MSRDVDGAARDVEAAINAARSYLPSNLPANPTYRKIDSARAPVLVLIWLQDSLFRRPLRQRIGPSSSKKSLESARWPSNDSWRSLPAVRVDLNPQQLSHYGLGFRMWPA